MTTPPMPDFSGESDQDQDFWDDDLKSNLEKVAVTRIVIDHRVQRAKLNPAKINNMVANFFAPALGTVVLSRRSNGTYVALDGWHRTEACKLHPGAPSVIDARVFEDLTLQQEARLFRLLNNRTSMHIVDLFNVQAVEGDGWARKVIEIVESFGGKVRTDSFAAVKAAQRIVERPNGFDLFTRALDVISDSWTTADKKSLDGRIVEGLAVFLEYYDAYDVDERHLKKNLKDLGADGAKQIIDLALPYHQARGGRVATAVCDVLVTKYNKGRTGARRLPEYQRKG